MWNPSFDFSLFDVRDFSPLQMQEYGAQTFFRASDPVGYVDFALSQLSNLTNPNSARPYLQRQFPSDPVLMPPDSFFQQSESAVTLRDRLIRVRDEANRKLGELGEPATPPRGGNTQDTSQTKRGCTFWDLITFNCTPAWKTASGEAEAGSNPVLKSDDSSVGGNAGAFFRNLPQGAGIFLVGIIALIFLLLFARR